MSEPTQYRGGGALSARAGPQVVQGGSANLADILERVLDKGIIIAGDIKINLLDIELLTIKLRLLIVSVDKAREMGIDWWEHDPALSSRAREEVDQRHARELSRENERLRQELESMREVPGGQERREPIAAGDPDDEQASRRPDEQAEPEE